MAGNRLSPEEAYRFARGEEVVSSTGVPAKLSRPLDFLVISDHAEGLGLMFQVYEGNPAFMSGPDPGRMEQGDEGRRQGRRGRRQRRGLRARRRARCLRPIKDPKIVGPVMKSVWQQYTATAEKYNDPGTLHGDDRLRVDLGAGRQQPAPQRAVPRRQGQGRPGIPVLRLAERGPGEALGVDGPVRDRRRAAACSRSRTTATSRTGACSS